MSNVKISVDFRMSKILLWCNSKLYTEKWREGGQRRTRCRSTPTGDCICVQAHRHKEKINTLFHLMGSIYC